MQKKEEKYFVFQHWSINYLNIKIQNAMQSEWKEGRIWTEGNEVDRKNKEK